MVGWFGPAVLAMLLFGLWGFFPKLAAGSIDPRSALVYQVAGGLAVGIVVLFVIDFKPQTHPQGVLFAVLTGVTGVLGTLFYYAAAGRGPLAAVVSLTALYPLITIALAFLILREPITLRQVAGLLCALAAIILFAGG